MIQILCGDEGHRARCAALSSATPASSVANANGPALDKKVMKITTLTFWGHGDASAFCGLSAVNFVKKVQEWVKWNPTIKTVEIITCNARHGTLESNKRDDGAIETSWVKGYTDQVKPGLRKMGLTVKALPMGMGANGANRWSILKYSPATQTWLYVTANGAKDTDEMWPGVHAVEQHDTFQANKNFALSGAAVKSTMSIRNFTLDYGSIGDLRKALVTLS